LGLQGLKSTFVIDCDVINYFFIPFAKTLPGSENGN